LQLADSDAPAATQGEPCAGGAAQPTAGVSLSTERRIRPT